MMSKKEKESRERRCGHCGTKNKTQPMWKCTSGKSICKDLMFHRKCLSRGIGAFFLFSSASVRVLCVGDVCSLLVSGVWCLTVYEPQRSEELNTYMLCPVNWDRVVRVGPSPRVIFGSFFFWPYLAFSESNPVDFCFVIFIYTARPGGPNKFVGSKIYFAPTPGAKSMNTR